MTHAPPFRNQCLMQSAYVGMHCECPQLLKRRGVDSFRGFIEQTLYGSVFERLTMAVSKLIPQEELAIMRAELEACKGTTPRFLLLEAIYWNVQLKIVPKDAQDMEFQVKVCSILNKSKKSSHNECNPLTP